MPYRFALTGGTELWDLIGAVLIFCALMLGAWLILRFLQNRGHSFGRRSRYIETLDQLPMSRDYSIVIVRVAGRILVVSSGREGGQLLCELTEEQWNTAGGETTRRTGKRPAAAEALPMQERTQGFGRRFWHNLRIQLGLLPKSTAPLTPQSERDAARKQERPAPPPVKPSPPPPADSFAHILNHLQRGDTAPPRAEAPPISAARRAKGIFSDEDMAKYHSAARPSHEENSDEETARELVDMLQSMSAERSHSDKPATPAAPAAQPATPDEGHPLDDMLDQIARRQQKYAARGRKRKDAP